MGNNILTDTKCNEAENLANQILAKAQKIRELSPLFVSMISRDDVSAWVTDTGKGAEAKERIVANAEAFENLAIKGIERIANDTFDLVNLSRKNNK